MPLDNPLVACPAGDIATQFHALQVVHIDIFCIRFTEDSRYVVYDFVFAV